MQLELEDLVVRHGTVEAVRGARLSLRSGTALAVLGANGAGKSSCVGAIAGWYPAASGRVLLDGVDLAPVPVHRRARMGVGVVPETSTLFPLLTVGETLRVASRHARSARWTIEDVLELFPRLAERRWTRVGNLSGGERQMLAIARALLAGPEIVILDEPSAGLAPIVVGQLAAVISDLVEAGIGLCLFEQSVLLAERIGCQAVQMHDGVIGGAVDVTEDAKSLRVKYFRTARSRGSGNVVLSSERSAEQSGGDPRAT